MTIDVNVKKSDDAFLDDIDEIIEDTMVQMFFLQPDDAAALEKAKEEADEYTALFYVIPAELLEEADGNCVGCRLRSARELETVLPLGKPLYIDEADLDAAFETALIAHGASGIILNATRSHDNLEHFYIAVGPSNIAAFDPETLARLSMDKIVLQSGYPDHGFDAIFSAVKTLSDAMFRPEQSIIARATKHTLELSGFKK